MATRPRAPRASKAPASAVPAFAGVTERQLRSLATRIGKLDDEYRIEQALDAALDASGAYDERLPLAWHLVVHGLLDPAANDVLLEVLAAGARDGLDEAKARAVAALLARRGATESQRAAWLPGWTHNLDALVFEAHAAIPEAFDALAPQLAPSMQLGLAFVRGRRGLPVDPAVGLRIARALAEAETTGYGLGGGRLPVVDASGATVEHDMMAETGLRDLALRFCARDAWDAILREVALRNEWDLIEKVGPALEQLPLDTLSHLLATRGHRRVLSDSSDATRTMLSILAARRDAPDALLAAPEQLPESPSDAALVRGLYAITAIRRLVAEHRPVPAEALDALDDLELLRDRHAADETLEALRALPAGTVLARVRGALSRSSSKAALGALGAHFDHVLLEEVLATDDHVDHEILGLLGGPAVEALGAAARRATTKVARESRLFGMVLAMGRAVAAGTVPPPGWSELLADVVDGDGPRHGLGAFAEPLAPVLAAIAAARGAPVPTSPLPAPPRRGQARPPGWDDLDRLVAAARAADPSSPTLRLYLLRHADPLHPARAGSLSRAGGPAPALDRASVPRSDDGEAYEHLVTLDVADVPELGARYPGARALALFCLDPMSGEHLDEVELVVVPAAGGAPAPPLVAPAAALAVRPIEVPASVFSSGDRLAAIDTLRDAIASAGGHVLGRPLWIQEHDGSDDGLLLQIDDGLVPELNLGDVGSLYVFEDGWSIHHSH